VPRGSCGVSVASVPGVYALLRLYLDGCVRCVKWLISDGEERACVELNVNSKYACSVIGIGGG
jgi:hypothetical protein